MKNQIETTLKQIRSSADSLEILAYSSVASMEGKYGTEDEAYTQRRINDVLMMLERLQELHTDLKQAMEGAK
jgi:hypothetical protein